MVRLRSGRAAADHAAFAARLRALEVSGIFELGDPDGLLHSVEQTMAVRVVRRPLLTVIY